MKAGCSVGPIERDQLAFAPVPPDPAEPDAAALDPAEPDPARPDPIEPDGVGTVVAVPESVVPVLPEPFAGASASDAAALLDTAPLPTDPPIEGATSGAGEGLTLVVGVPVGSALGSALGLVSVPVLGSELEFELWVGAGLVTAGPAVGRLGCDGTVGAAEEPWDLGCCGRSLRTTMRPIGRPVSASAFSWLGEGANPEEPGIAWSVAPVPMMIGWPGGPVSIGGAALPGSFRVAVPAMTAIIVGTNAPAISRAARTRVRRAADSRPRGGSSPNAALIGVWTTMAHPPSIDGRKLIVQ